MQPFFDEKEVHWTVRKEVSFDNEVAAL